MDCGCGAEIREPTSSELSAAGITTRRRAKSSATRTGPAPYYSPSTMLIT